MSLTQFLRYGVGEPETYERKRPYYLMKKDGVYRHTSTGAMLIKEKYVDFGKVTVPGLQEGEVGVSYMLPKIPFKYWLMILDFYKAVYDKSGTEASVHIYYAEEDLEIPEELEKYKVGLIQDGNWIIYCPQQVNRATLTSFGNDELYNWFRLNTISVIETHSHNVMDAFWSGTDDKNQQDTQYYGVYGRVTTDDKFIMKYVINGKSTAVSVDEIFEFPMIKIAKTVMGVEGYDVCMDDGKMEETEVYTGMFKRKDEFPEEWLNECHSTTEKQEELFRVKGN